MFFDNPSMIQSFGGKIDKQTGRNIVIGSGEYDRGQYDTMLEVDAVAGCALMIRREVVEKIGLLDERYFCYFEEYDWCFRAKQEGYEVVAVPNSRIRHKDAVSSGGTSSPTRIYYSVRNHLLFLDKNAYMMSRLGRWIRNCIVAAYYVAFVLLRSDAPKIGGIRACLIGCLHYTRGRFGPIDDASS